MASRETYRVALMAILRLVNGTPVKISSVDLARIVHGTPFSERPAPREVAVAGSVLSQAIREPRQGWHVEELAGSTVTAIFRREGHDQ